MIEKFGIAFGDKGDLYAFILIVLMILIALIMAIWKTWKLLGG